VGRVCFCFRNGSGWAGKWTSVSPCRRPRGALLAQWRLQPSAVDSGLSMCRGLHSSTFQLNLSRFRHKIPQKHPLSTPDTPCIPAEQPLHAPPIPQKALTLSRKVDECKPLPVRSWPRRRRDVVMHHARVRGGGGDTLTPEPGESGGAGCWRLRGLGTINE
jgi:hypothetical protein